jgi:hypothetical protein
MSLLDVSLKFILEPPPPQIGGLCYKPEDAGSSPDEVIGFFFNLSNPSSRTMALGSTQPLTEMSARNLPGG